MPAEIGPVVRRRQLAMRLKELRTAAGFGTMDAAAAATGLSRATISRIESAKQVILPRTVRLLCHAYGIGSATMAELLHLAAVAGEDRGWQLDHAGAVPDWFERYLGEEADATEIWTYAAETVPGLLQTDAYCRTVHAAAHPGADTDQHAALTAARGQRLVARHPPALHVVLNEAVLHRQVGGPDTTAGQLAQLLELAGQPAITLQVLPFAAGAHPAMSGGFTVLRFPPSTGVATVYTEVDSFGFYRDRPADIDRHTWLFTALREAALPAEESRALLANLADAIQRVN
jgi:transcriptional regulator with XRE-family HTH domain